MNTNKSNKKTTDNGIYTLLATVPKTEVDKVKHKKCTANKGDYPCTIFGCPWCEDCALYK